jgi:ribosomal protein L40E
MQINKCIECNAPVDNPDHELCKECFKHNMRVKENLAKYGSGNWFFDNWQTILMISAATFFIGYLLGTL